ncbi:MAG: TIGR00180 family glycosyltransferase [Elusimicrobiota bacterium]
MIDIKNLPVTIIVSSFNRPQFLRKLCLYFIGQEEKFPVLFGDASYTEKKQSVQAIAEEFKMETRFSFHDFESGYPLYPLLFELLKKVKTPYVMLLADDDFVATDFLPIGIDFLDKEPSYSLVHGNSLIAIVSSNDIPQSTQQYSQLEQHADDRLDRLINHLGAYSTTAFSIHRTDQMLKNFAYLINLKTDHRFSEVLESCLSVVQGKVKKMDNLFLVRRMHPQQDSVQLGLKEDDFDWVTSKKWAPQYELFLDILKKEVEVNSPELKKKFDVEVKRSMWTYMGGFFGPPPFPGRTSRQLLADFVNKLILSDHFNISTYFKKNEDKLSELINSKSKYSRSFIPIYKILMSPLD